MGWRRASCICTDLYRVREWWISIWEGDVACVLHDNKRVVSHTMMLNYMSVDVKSGLLQPCAWPLFLLLLFFPHLFYLYSLAHLALFFTELFHLYYRVCLTLCEHVIVSVTHCTASAGQPVGAAIDCYEPPTIRLGTLLATHMARISFR